MLYIILGTFRSLSSIFQTMHVCCISVRMGSFMSFGQVFLLDVSVAFKQRWHRCIPCKCSRFEWTHQVTLNTMFNESLGILYFVLFTSVLMHSLWCPGWSSTAWVLYCVHVQAKIKLIFFIKSAWMCLYVTFGQFTNLHLLNGKCTDSRAEATI